MPAKEKKPLTVSQILNSSMDNFVKNIQTWVQLGLLVFIPTAVWGLLVNIIYDAEPYSDQLFNSSSSDPSLGWFAIGEFTLFIYQIIISAIFVTAFILSVKSKKMPDFKTVLQKGWANVLGVVVATILLVVFIFAGLILLVIPGLLIAFFFGFTVFVVADEKKPVFEAMGVSKDLVKDNVGLVLLTVLALVGVAVLIQITTGLIFSLLGPAEPILVGAVTAALQIFFGIVSATLYLDMKKRHESPKSK